MILRQSMMKQVVKKGNLLRYCPRKVKEIYIDQRYNITTEAMLRGQYFESQTIGGTAHKDELVTDLPRLKNGGKSARHKRVDDQILKFQTLANQHGMVIDPNKIQYEIAHPWPEDEKYTIQGVIDLLSPISYADGETGEMVDLPLAIIDIKLTENLYTTYGDFSWAYPSNMDHLQAQCYSWLFKQNYEKDIPFFYWVFDYKPSGAENQLFLKKIDNTEMAEFKQTVRTVIAEIEFNQETGWEERPSEENCKKCPLRINEACNKAMTRQTAKIIY